MMIKKNNYKNPYHAIENAWNDNIEEINEYAISALEEFEKIPSYLDTTYGKETRIDDNEVDNSELLEIVKPILMSDENDFQKGSLLKEEMMYYMEEDTNISADIYSVIERLLKGESSEDIINSLESKSKSPKK